ncbi:hypothetical protein [Stetteria hydrogenophila]
MLRNVVVEHLEERATRWLVAEYLEVIKVAREAGLTPFFTNVRDEALAALLEKSGARVDPRPGWSLFNTPYTIVLDLEAEKQLEPWELAAADTVVIGGIMGDHPPRGRTRLISFMYTDAAKRNLGPHQFSVDGAARVVVEVFKGKRLKDLKIQVGVSFKVNTLQGEIEVFLPFAYPVGEDGEPLLSSRVRKLLERGVTWDELEG